MTDKTMLLKVDGTDYCLETNLNLTDKPSEYYCQIWLDDGRDIPKFVHWTRGEYAITDAVLWLNDYLHDLIAHRVRRVK